MCKECLKDYIANGTAQLVYSKSEGRGGKFTKLEGETSKNIDRKMWFVATFANLFHEYCKDMAEMCEMQYDDCEDLLRDFITPDSGSAKEPKMSISDDPDVHVVKIDGSEDPKKVIEQIIGTILEHIKSNKNK